MASPLLRTLENFLRQHHIRDQVLIVGVSGGADSLALLHSLCELRNSYHLQLHVAHLNHQLRGDDSKQDARFVEQLASDWQLPATVESHDVAELARAKKLSTEEAARLVRYGFLEQVAEREGARAVAVAHHADDQVETILMHFIRGAGLAGLRGMLANTHYPFRPPLRLLRPLLGVTRAEIETYCAAHQLAPREDASNADTKYFRNRLRHELLPMLEQYNPNLRAVLVQNARIVSDDYDYLMQRSRGAYERTSIDRTQDGVAFSLSGWRSLQPSLKRALIRLAVTRLHPALRNLDARHIENALRVADSARVGARATLPEGLWLFRDFDAIVIGEKFTAPDLPRASAHPVRLTIPGQVRVDKRWRLDAHTLSREHLPANALQGIDPLEAFFDASKLPDELNVRARKPLDHFAPLGLHGKHKPLRRFMIDAKIPEAWRSRTPLVVAGDDVIWIVGWRIADTVKVTAETERVLHLKFVRADE